MLKRFFKGGTKVPHYKNTEESATVIMGVPERVKIPMLQHIGAPCSPKVKKGDEVKVGQVIGESTSFVSSVIHSSVSGKVIDVVETLYPGGFEVMTVEISTDGLQQIYEDIKPPKCQTKDELLEAIKQSGLVGLGGAGFPTHIKLNPPKDKKVDILIINAAECEPYITADYREIIENSVGVMQGIKIASEVLGVSKVIIGIEDNKPLAITKLKDEINFQADILKNIDVEVKTLSSIYPQGAEKTLIFATTGRKVPAGKLPADAGVVVMNVNTVSFLDSYIRTGMPLIKKRITVDGSAVAKPMNVEVLIGTTLEDVFEFCGGFNSEPRKVLMGGPMMGIAQFSLETSVIKQTNAILAFDEEAAKLPKESACIRCGKCIEACPMNLMPLYLNLHGTKGNREELSTYHVMDCIECGSCAFVCPAKRHLVQSIRLGKATLRKKK